MRNFLILLVLLSGCTEKIELKNVNPENQQIISKKSVGLNHQPKEGSSVIKEFSGIHFQCHSLPAIDYLKRKGEKIEKEDIPSLSEESVFIFEISIPKSNTEILKSPKNTMTMDDLNKYLTGEINNDFEVEQNSKSYKPNGSIYESSIGNGKKMRVYFFLKGIKVTEGMTIRFYDRIFNTGLMKFKINDTYKINV